MKTALIVAIAVFGFFCSCSDTPSGIEGKGANYPTSPEYFGPFNSENPFDSLGINHNYAVNYALSQLTVNDTTLALCINSMRGSLDHWISNHSTMNHDLIELIADSAYAFVQLYSGALENYLSYPDTSIWSEGELDYIYRVRDAFIMWPDQSAVKDSILQIETDIVANNLSSDNILAFISIAKHSLYYWTAVTAGLSKRSRQLQSAGLVVYLWPESVIVADVGAYMCGLKIAQDMDIVGAERIEFAQGMTCTASAMACEEYWNGGPYPAPVTDLFGL